MTRIAMTALIALLFTLTGANSATMGEDGLHKQEWFALTFRDVAEDIQAANDEGKRLVLIFEQRGCSYCRKMHEVLFTDAEVVDYLKTNYKVVQFNMFGDEEVTDLDGTTLTEKTAARKWGYLFTPTIVFLPDEAPEGTSVAQAAVSIMPGYFNKGTFLDMFKWVREKGYETDEHFQKYHQRKILERQGKAAND